MLESYVTPILMSYVNRYIKNLKPSDLQLSLWGGDVVLSKLELKLDVLEQELKLPFTFLSGHIHELRIHVPWTKLGSEPVVITINTMECILKLKDGIQDDHESCGSNSTNRSTSENTKSSTKPRRIQQAAPTDPDLPPGYVQSLIRRVVNNVNIVINNLILKYVEDDIVLSVNITSAECYTVSELWDRAFMDISATDLVLRKVINFSDCTVCLDKRNASGKIEFYQDPLLYKCSFRTRLHFTYDNLNSKMPSVIKIHTLVESLKLSITDQQLPMFIRIMQLGIALYYGEIGNLKDGEMEDPTCHSKDTLGNIAGSEDETRIDMQYPAQYKGQELYSQDYEEPQGWVSWAWSFVPAIVSYDDSEEDNLGNDPGSTMHQQKVPALKDPIVSVGFYCTKATVTFKLTEMQAESSYYSPQKVKSKEVLCWEQEGTTIEALMMGEPFFDCQIGFVGCRAMCLKGIMGVRDFEEHTSRSETEACFFICGENLSTKGLTYLTNSLFDYRSPENNGTRAEFILDAAHHKETYTEMAGMQRFGAFYMDYLYTMERSSGKGLANQQDFPSGKNEDLGIVQEKSTKSLVIGPLDLRLDSSAVHRILKMIVCALEHEYEPYSGLKPESKDEKETMPNPEELASLEEYIPTRHTSVTLLRCTCTIFMAEFNLLDRLLPVIMGGKYICSFLLLGVKSKNPLPTLEGSIQNVELKYCSTTLVRCASGTVGSIKICAKAPESRPLSVPVKAMLHIHEGCGRPEERMKECIGILWNAVKSLTLQLDVQSCCVFIPNDSLPSPSTIVSGDIPGTVRSWYHGQTSTPGTLVLCLPQIKVISAGHKCLEPLQEIPFVIPRPILEEGDAFPWTISLRHFSIYTLLGKQVTLSLVEPMGCTSTLAVTSQKLLPPGPDGRHSFVVCLHVDLESLEIKCSNPQVQLFYELADTMSKVWNRIQKRGNLSSSSIYPESMAGPVPGSPVRSSVGTALPDNSTCSPSADIVTTTEGDSVQAGDDSPFSDSVTLEQTTSSIGGSSGRVSLWLQCVLPKLTVKLFAADVGNKGTEVCMVSELEDLSASIDVQDVYTKVKCKIESFNVDHYQSRPGEGWQSGHFEGVFLQCKEKPVTTTKLLDGSHQQHGFLSLTYTKAVTKNVRHKLTSRNERRSFHRLSEGFMDGSPHFLHEILLSAQAFDVVLCFPLLNAIASIFQTKLPRTQKEKRKSTGQPMRTHALTSRNLPLIYINTSVIRIFVPQTEETQSTVEALNLGILRDPGSEIEDRQYQIDLQSINIGTAQWDQLKPEKGSSTGGVLTESERNSQNPALEWNMASSIRRHQERRAILTPILTDFSVRITGAPAIIFTKIISPENLHMEISKQEQKKVDTFDGGTAETSSRYSGAQDSGIGSDSVKIRIVQIEQCSGASQHRIARPSHQSSIVKNLSFIPFDIFITASRISLMTYSSVAVPKFKVPEKKEDGKTSQTSLNLPEADSDVAKPNQACISVVTAEDLFSNSFSSGKKGRVLSLESLHASTRSSARQALGVTVVRQPGRRGTGDLELHPFLYLIVSQPSLLLSCHHRKQRMEISVFDAVLKGVAPDYKCTGKSLEIHSVFWGQEHLNCLALLHELLSGYLEEEGKFEVPVPESAPQMPSPVDKTQAFKSEQSSDDLRTGVFQYIQDAEYWDELQKVFVAFREFSLSESKVCELQLPDVNLVRDQKKLVSSDLWRIVLNNNQNATDDQSSASESGSQSTCEPLVTPTALAVCTRVDSCFTPWFVPSLCMSFQFAHLELHLCHHLDQLGTASPQHLQPFISDRNVPSELEYMVISFKEPNLYLRQWNSDSVCHEIRISSQVGCKLLEYRNVTMQSVVKPFGISGQMALSNDGEQKVLDGTVIMDSVLVNFGQHAVHSLNTAIQAWQQNKCPEVEELVFSHFVICNDTQETLRFGQVDTDENILLASLHSHQYSWRSHKSPQIIICGRQIICSYLSQSIELKVVQHYIGQDGQAVVREHFDCLTAKKKLPSYILENSELTELCVKAKGDEDWSRDVCLEPKASEYSTVIQVPASNSSIIYVWCTVLTLEPNSQVQQRMIVFSPLFIMRSHLPDPIIIHLEKRSLGLRETQIIPGKGQENPLQNAEPDLAHHLTFQAREEHGPSDCAIPISTALIKQIATKTQPGGTVSEMLDEFYGARKSLEPVWPYNKKDSDRNEQLSQWDSPMRVKLSIWKPYVRTLLIELLPWALLINQSKWDLWLFEGEKIVLQVPSGKIIIPPNFQEAFQIGIYWANTNTVHKSIAIKLVHNVTSPKWKDSGNGEVVMLDEEALIDAEIRLGAFPGHQKLCQFCISSVVQHGIQVIQIEDKTTVINNTPYQILCKPQVSTASPYSGKEHSHVADSATFGICPGGEHAAVKCSSLPCWDFMPDVGPSVDTAELQKQILLGFSPAPGADSSQSWSLPAIVRREFPRQSVAVPFGTLRENGFCTRAIALTYQEHFGVTYLTLSEDPSPRVIFHNRCPVAMLVKENMRDIPKFEVYCKKIPPESSVHHELYHQIMGYPDCKTKDLLPSLLLRTESTEEMTVEWSDAVDINSQGTQVVFLTGFGYVYVDIAHQCGTVIITLAPEGKAGPILTGTHRALEKMVTFKMFITRLSLAVSDDLTHHKTPSELVRLTLDNIFLHVCPVPGILPGEEPPSTLLQLFRVEVYFGDLQLDNQLYNKSNFHFAVLVCQGERTDPVQYSRVQSLLTSNKDLEEYKESCFIKLCLTASEGTDFLFDVSEFSFELKPARLYVEDTFVYYIKTLFDTYLPHSRSAGHDAQLSAGGQTLPVQVRQHARALVNPVKLRRLVIQPVSLLVSIHASLKLYIASDHTPLSFSVFERGPVFTTARQLVHALAMHYAAGALFRAGWVVGSLEILGSPASLVRSIGNGISDFFRLPYEGLTRGPGAFVSGVSRGTTSFVKHISKGTLTSITNLATSLARNMDRLSLDEEHYNRQEEWRRQLPESLGEGLRQGLSRLGISLLGAIAGIVDQPMQNFQKTSETQTSAGHKAKGVISGVGKGIMGVFTKPIGGAAELVSQTGYGILHGAGLSQLPKQRYQPGDLHADQAPNSHVKYVWKMLQSLGRPEVHMALDVVLVRGSGQEHEGCLLLTSEVLFVVSISEDTQQQAFPITEIDCAQDTKQNNLLTVQLKQPRVACDVEVDGTRERLSEQQFNRLVDYIAKTSCHLAPSCNSMQTACSVVAVEPPPATVKTYHYLVDPHFAQVFISKFTMVKNKALRKGFP
ncbi:Vps13b [Phodopus roborovskii]|uniref:Vps13b protein n=1 Tax=Phodopus roborovskii TaxID=109678 RepID=A0AAV0A0B1_PHORO|nr:Vps13b [Phodopus roborovskii]